MYRISTGEQGSELSYMGYEAKLITRPSLETDMRGRRKEQSISPIPPPLVSRPCILTESLVVERAMGVPGRGKSYGSIRG
jgi:hypothetical protein